MDAIEPLRNIGFWRRSRGLGARKSNVKLPQQVFVFENLNVEKNGILPAVSPSPCHEKSPPRALSKMQRFVDDRAMGSHAALLRGCTSCP
jgi:hypothetical protein